MDRIRIIGGTPLHGTVNISGAKNAVLPLMAASLLTEDPIILENVPNLADIETMVSLLEHHGVTIDSIAATNHDDHPCHTYTLCASSITDRTAPYDIVRKMRASVLVLGPLLSRFGDAKVSLPGGCAIGTRPIDLHLYGLERLGADIRLEEGYVHATAPNGLTGAEIEFEKVSVGATENILMAATLAKGKTTIKNAAREPEIIDLANCLISMGAHIEGAGSDTITVEGKAHLSGTTHYVLGDRIEAGTYAVAAAITRGSVDIVGVDPTSLISLLERLEKAGMYIDIHKDGFKVSTNGTVHALDMTTRVYPGFATDMQAQMMALMCVAKGRSIITETIFENRFMHVPELMRMGANISIDGASANIKGVEKLKGAEVMATDLRASVSLILAGLIAEGETIVNRVYHLDRGYESLEKKLANCGANIQRIPA